MVYTSDTFTFEPLAGETISDRIVHCCLALLEDGKVGHQVRHDVYRDFIACNREETLAKAEALSTVRTSCALFVRAVRQWCGAEPVGPYVIGSPMFSSIGHVSFAHAAFVPNADGNSPNPGDFFYISSSRTSNDGHTGIFIAESEPGVWQTAEGGGGADGTECALRQRTIVGPKFSNDHRTLHGWFDCTKVGIPE